MPESSSRFFRGVLDPIERISEILFGLIMALTFTGTLSAASAGRAEVREMLLGAIGCNLAWGLVDGSHVPDRLPGGAGSQPADVPGRVRGGRPGIGAGRSSPAHCRPPWPPSLAGRNWSPCASG